MGIDPEDEAGHHWFEELADHMGPAYLKYSFTRGTANEVAFLVDQLGLRPGMRVLDVGCGPGRHSLALAALGIETVGIDISQRFVDLANEAAEKAKSETDTPAPASFHRLDARNLTFDAEFDAVISLCQGAFGLSGGPAADSTPPDAATTVAAEADLSSVDVDLPVLAGMTRALRPGGRLAFSAFSAYFQVRWLEDTDDFDAAAGVNRETTSVRNPAGEERSVDLWTSCFTPRELRLLCRSAGLVVEEIHSVTPGAYAVGPPSIDQPEFLVIARRP